IEQTEQERSPRPEGQAEIQHQESRRNENRRTAQDDSKHAARPKGAVQFPHEGGHHGIAKGRQQVKRQKGKKIQGGRDREDVMFASRRGPHGGILRRMHTFNSVAFRRGRRKPCRHQGRQWAWPELPCLLRVECAAILIMILLLL
ncbi:MAG TPA: hypothetical protein PLS82_09180, partial [Phycisphaerae bacterium]|nr:hypothetical protein [Phycisphaerae bacterium]